MPDPRFLREIRDMHQLRKDIRRRGRLGVRMVMHSVYGFKSVPYNDLGACIDYNAHVLAAQKKLSALARDAANMQSH